MYENAKKAELPKWLSGSGKQRLKSIKDKQQKAPDKLTGEEKLFLEYVDYINTKRRAYFLEKKQREDANKANADNKTEGENEDVDMSSSTQG